MLPVFYSDEFLLHDTGLGHPERPERLRAIVAALRAAPWADLLDWRSPGHADATAPLDASAADELQGAIARVHDPDYVRLVRHLANRGGGFLDGDTPVSPRSYEVALLAVRAWLDGLDCVLETGDPALVLARPPGHHALRDRGMGFCLLSNAAIAAYAALDRPDIDRVAIFDWDVHHGNGTQALTEADPRIAYCSIHQSPAYPGTGDPAERGTDNTVLNLPVPRGTAGADYERLWTDRVEPFLKTFAPDAILVSAGYDANAADPLAGVALQPPDYGWLARRVLALNRAVLFGLEGGYDLPSLSASVVETAAACLAVAVPR